MIDEVPGLMSFGKINQLDLYFNHSWAKPVAYYNAFSALLYQQKITRKLKVSSSEYKITDDGTLVLQFSGTNPVFHLVAPKDETYALAVIKKLVKISSQPIIIHTPDFIPTNPKLILFRNYEQAIYECNYIVNTIESDLNGASSVMLNKRSKTTFKKNALECHFRQATYDDKQHITTLLSSWAKGAQEHNKEQYLFKDLTSIEWLGSQVTPPKLAFIGWRDLHPITYSFIATLPGNPGFGSLVISKSLNYSSVPGGYNETSVWEIYQYCKACVKEGIKKINASTLGCEIGLKSFKEKFTNNQYPNISTSDWVWH